MTDAKTEFIDIVFDGEPAHEGARFIEAEHDRGESITFGGWIKPDDSYWVLRILPDALSKP